MKQSKKRYSIPAKLVELMFADDSFFNDVSKLKKASSSGRFPKTDQWASESGFNMNFALAGYSIDDVTVEAFGNSIQIRSSGLESEKYTPPAPSESEDAFQEYNKGAKPIIHAGYVSRGIARRSFDVSYIISEEFDVSKSEAYMCDGLLHIFIPNCLKENMCEVKAVNIKNERKQ